MSVRRVNLATVAPATDPDDPDGYRAAAVRLGPLVGAAQLGATLYELPPGQAVCPYHYHYGEEEWLLVLEGAPTLRTPEGESALAVGDIVCFPDGPDGAHKVFNATDAAVRVLMWSPDRPPWFSVYPDSDKVGVYPGPSGDPRDRVLVRRGTSLGYYDGE